MSSQIDTTKPIDGAPASKADLRANLQSAKDEIEALQSGKADLGHQHELADISDAGTLASKNTVAAVDIDDDAVTNAKLANMAAATIKGRAAGAGTGEPTDLTAAQAKTALAISASDVSGLGTLATLNQVASAQISDDAVTYSKMQNVSAASRLLGRGQAGGAGDPEEIVLGSGLSMTGTTLSSASSVPVNDTTALVHDPIDNTKRARIDAGAIATSTTRSITMGDRNVDLAAGGTFAELNHTHTLANVTNAGALAALNQVGSAQIADDAVTNVKLANMAPATFKGRAAGAGTGDPADLTAAQAKTALAISTSDVSGLGTLATLNQIGFLGLADTSDTYAGQASQFVKVKADETGLEFAPAPGGSGGLTGWVDVKTDFGAVGNGTTVDNTAIQNALNSGASVIYFPPGTYRVTAQLTVAPGTKIVGAGPGKTIIDASGASLSDGSAVFKCTGSTVSLPALSSSITQGGGSIAYASSVAGSLVHGDWVRLRDTTANSFSSADGSQDGFVCMVQSAEGSTLYPAQHILRTLPAPRTSGALGNVTSTKLDKRGLVIEDLTILGSGFNSTSGGGGATGAAIWALDLANVYVNRVRVLGGGSDGIRLQQSANCHVTDCDVTVHTGDWPGTQQYALHSRGSSYVFLTSSNFFCPRHAVDISGGNGTSHNVIVNGCTIGAPGTPIFQQPSSAANVALDWHGGNFHSKVVNCYIQGSVTLRGQSMEIIGCTLENPNNNNIGMIGVDGVFGPAPDFRIEGCKIYLHRAHFQSGMLYSHTDSGWNGVDAGGIGSIVIANNEIYVMINSSEPLINIQNNNVYSPATGTIHIMGNRVVHKAGATSQPFANITIGDGAELVLSDNSLPANMTLGTIGTDFVRKVLSPNTINGHVVMTGLPTANPGGSGRLWSDAGTLKIT